MNTLWVWTIAESSGRNTMPGREKLMEDLSLADVSLNNRDDVKN
jgi:hypothetical protein